MLVTMFRELKQLAPQIYYFPYDRDPNIVQANIGLLKLPSQTVLIDAGNSPGHAQTLLTAMVGEGFAPIDTLIYTHHHWDHTFGAMIFNAQQIIAHDSHRVYMRSYLSQEWTTNGLRTAMRDPDTALRLRNIVRANTNWDDFRLCEANILFEKALTRYVDGYPIELEYVGGRHADDSIIVRLPEAGVVFLGDCYYPPPLFRRQFGDEALDIAMLQRIVNPDYDVYLDGHGTPRSYQAMCDLIDEELAQQQN